jgi:hypothetical protein
MDPVHQAAQVLGCVANQEPGRGGSVPKAIRRFLEQPEAAEDVQQPVGGSAVGSQRPRHLGGRGFSTPHGRE